MQDTPWRWPLAQDDTGALIFHSELYQWQSRTGLHIVRFALHVAKREHGYQIRRARECVTTDTFDVGPESIWIYGHAPHCGCDARDADFSAIVPPKWSEGAVGLLDELL